VTGTFVTSLGCSRTRYNELLRPDTLMSNLLRVKTFSNLQISCKTFPLSGLGSVNGENPRASVIVC